MARPSKFNQELLDKSLKYVQGDYKSVSGSKEVVPTVAGLALYLDIARSQVYKYADENKEFSNIVEALQALQERRLLNFGLLNKFNSTIAKLMLAKHGYKDEVGIDQKVEFIYPDESNFTKLE